MGRRGAQRLAAGGQCRQFRRFSRILGICEGAKEDKSGWSAFLRHLVDHGLNGVQLIISDACRGLMESAAESVQRRAGNAAWFISTGTSSVTCRRPEVHEVDHMLKAIHAQENREAADHLASDK